MGETEETDRQNAFVEFEKELRKIVSLQQVEYATAQDYETAYTPPECEFIVRATITPIGDLDGIETADELKDKLSGTLVSSNGIFIDSNIDEIECLDTEPPIYYFAVRYSD